jgi:hypothetical protein
MIDYGWLGKTAAAAEVSCASKRGSVGHRDLCEARKTTWWLQKASA